MLFSIFWGFRGINHFLKVPSPFPVQTKLVNKCLSLPEGNRAPKSVAQHCRPQIGVWCFWLHGALTLKRDCFLRVIPEVPITLACPSAVWQNHQPPEDLKNHLSFPKKPTPRESLGYSVANWETRRFIRHLFIYPFIYWLPLPVSFLHCEVEMNSLMPGNTANKKQDDF